VIRFKCIYCGQRILAPDGGGGKKGKCPKCAHLLTVPESTKGRPAISFDKEPMPDRPKPHIPEWAKEPGGFDDYEAKEAWSELYRESFGFLVPAYDIMSLLLPAVTWILLYLANSQMREWIRNGIIWISSVPGIVFIILFPLSILAALVLIFLAVIPFQISLAAEIGETIDFKKKVMMFLAVLINAGSGILIGIYLLSSSINPDWMIILPVWNIINCVLLLLMMLFKIIDEECITSRAVTPFGIIFGLLSILIIFALCTYVFKLNWAITFSICVVYTTSFDRALQNILPGLYRKKYTVGDAIKT